MKFMCFVVVVFALFCAVQVDRVESVAVTGEEHAQPEMVSLFNLLTEDACNELNNEFFSAKPTHLYPISFPKVLSPCHDQMYPYPEILERGNIFLKYGVDFQLGLKLVVRGYVLKDGDKVKIGETITVESADFDSSWYNKGGSNDCPPTHWVSASEMKSIIQNVFDYHKGRTDYPLCDATTSETIVADESIFGGKEVTLYRSSPGLRHCVNPIYAALICTADDENPDVNEIVVEKAGPVDVPVLTYTPKCVYYIEKAQVLSPEWNGAKTGLQEHYRLLIPVDGQYKVLSAPLEQADIQALESFDASGNGHITDDPASVLLNIPVVTDDREPIEVTANIIAVEDCNMGPNIDVVNVFKRSRLVEDAPLYVRIKIKNTGEMKALLREDDMVLNVAHYDVLYFPSNGLDAGEESEIIIEAKAESVDGLEMTVDYRSDELGCLATKDFSETFDLGEISAASLPDCRGDEMCPASEYGLEWMSCCAWHCYDPESGRCDDFDGDGYFEWMYY